MRIDCFMTRYMTYKGTVVIDDKRKIVLDDKNYRLSGFIPENFGPVTYLDGGVPLVRNKRLYDKDTGRLTIKLDETGEIGSRLLARLLDAEDKIVNPALEQNLFVAQIKRVI